MNWTIFWVVYALSIMCVCAQAFTSWLDGFFSPAQLHERGIEGWSFVQHGGMWADVIIISPLLAYIASNYKLAFTSLTSISILLIGMVVTFFLVKQWQEGGVHVPEAHTHFGVTPATGWIHAVYFLITLWILAQVFLSLTQPAISKHDLVAIAIALTPFFYFGAVKFGGSWWMLQGGASWLVASEVACIWTLALWRVVRA